MSAPTETKYVAEDLNTLPGGEHFELLDGQLVEKDMGAESSLVAALAIRHLGNYAAAHQLGVVLSSECGYQIFRNEPNRVRKPDVSFIKRGRLPDDKLPKGHVRIPPDLAVEVVSPNDLADEVNAKVQEAARSRCPFDMGVLSTNTPNLHLSSRWYRWRLTTADELSGENVLPGFVSRVEDLFAGV